MPENIDNEMTSEEMQTVNKALHKYCVDPGNAFIDFRCREGKFIPHQAKITWEKKNKSIYFWKIMWTVETTL